MERPEYTENNCSILARLYVPFYRLSHDYFIAFHSNSDIITLSDTAGGKNIYTNGGVYET